MLKTILDRTLWLAAIVLLLWTLTTQAEVPADRTADFAAAQSNLHKLRNDLHNLQASHGRYHPQLLEPLRQLAVQQMAVHRYGDAAGTVARGLQIARISHGLYSPRQYPWMRLSIETARLQQDWDSFNEHLDHYAWLLGSQYEGTAADRLEQLLWLTSTHMQAAFDDQTNRLARHLINATNINEAAVRYAHMTGQDDSERYLQALYSLTHAYFMETRAILGGGPASHELRRYGPEGSLIDRRSEAVSKRHLAGLDKLAMMRDAVRRMEGDNLEALGMVELYMADWQALFDETDNLQHWYQRSLNTLTDAGVDPGRLERFLAAPQILPRPTLALSVAQAQASDASAASFSVQSRSDDSDSLLQRVALLEPSADIPGYGLDPGLLDWHGARSKDWSRLTVLLELQPGQRQPVRYGSYLTHSRASGRNPRLLDQQGAEVKNPSKILRRVQNLAFRPAFRNGQAVAGEVAVEFVVNAGAVASLTPKLMMAAGPVSEPPIRGPQAPVPSASPVAAGE